MTKSRRDPARLQWQSGWACVAICAAVEGAPMSGRLSSYICWSASTGRTSSSLSGIEAFEVAVSEPGAVALTSTTPADKRTCDARPPRPPAAAEVGGGRRRLAITRAFGLEHSQKPAEIPADTDRSPRSIPLRKRARAPCYPSVLEVPWPVDLAVAALPGASSRRCWNSGEAETGWAHWWSLAAAAVACDGIARQAQLRRVGAAHRTPVVGPKLPGLASTCQRLTRPADTCRSRLGRGRLDLQSGMMAPRRAHPVVRAQYRCDVRRTSRATRPTSTWLTTSATFVEDQQTRVNRLLRRAAQTLLGAGTACELAADRVTPIVMLKIGPLRRCQRAALAHTGSLVGPDGVIDAALRKLG